jgi:hypothetical protein
MADAVYAVVDKSKHQRRADHENVESSLPGLDSPAYEKIADTPPLPKKSEDFESMVAYSTVSKPNQEREAEATIQEPSRITATKADHRKAGSSGCRIFACIFVTSTIVTAVIILICLAILFAEVSKLKTQNTFAQSTASQLMEDA